MRVLVTCRAGALDHAQARDALAPLGWLPGEDNAEFVVAKTLEVLARLPNDVRQELEHTDPILIEVRTGVWGFCSLERQRVLNFRLFNESPETLQEVALDIVRKVPAAFSAAMEREVDFPEPIEIRKTTNEETLAHGVVQRRHTLGFRDYVRTERTREYRVTRWLVILLVLCAVVSLVLFLGVNGDTSEYVRGWFDRAGTAFAVALLTALVGLLFEYREWRNAEEHIDWTFGTIRSTT